MAVVQTFNPAYGGGDDDQRDHVQFGRTARGRLCLALPDEPWQPTRLRARVQGHGCGDHGGLPGDAISTGDHHQGRLPRHGVSDYGIEHVQPACDCWRGVLMLNRSRYRDRARFGENPGTSPDKEIVSRSGALVLSRSGAQIVGR
jgi:hypothetical protein